MSAEAHFELTLYVNEKKNPLSISTVVLYAPTSPHSDVPFLELE